ncbi:hypothetical protein ACFQZC_09275 [Streptacidiphilus monticola]
MLLDHPDVAPALARGAHVPQRGRLVGQHRQQQHGQHGRLDLAEQHDDRRHAHLGHHRQVDQ